MKKSKAITEIADMLPEGLSEDTVVQIAKLVENIIKEEVTSRVTKLQSNAIAFVRAHIDDLKEQAVKELELENPTFRNASLFESIRATMSLELTEEDEANSAIKLAEAYKESAEEVEVLTAQLTEQLNENKKLSTITETQSGKIKVLEGKIKNAKTNAQKLREAAKAMEAKPFKSSEKAVVDSQNNGEDKMPLNEGKEQADTGNEFLTSDVMSFMPAEVKQ